MKILFIIPEFKSLSGKKSLTLNPHLGIAYLSAFLIKNGIEVKVFDNGIENSYERLFSLVGEFKPDMIGVTVFSYCYNYARELIKSVKSRFSVPLVIGGAHVNIIKKQILIDTEAEFAIKHEGEYGLLELLAEIKRSSLNFEAIKGLIWRNSEGIIIENPDRPFINDLDSLPFPEYGVFDIDKYFCYKDKMLPMVTSRGCPFSCNFCTVKLCMGQGFRPRSPENVVQEIEVFVKKGWKNFSIGDDCFTLDTKRAEEICDLIIEKKLNIGFQFLNGIRADRVTDGLLMKMKKAGCTYISYGCESGNDNILKIIKKNISREQVRTAVLKTNAVKIPNSVNFIIGHTEETYQTAMDTLDFAKSLPTAFTSFFNLIPYPGTEAYHWVRENGRFLISCDKYLENCLSLHDKPIFETDAFTKEQRQKIIRMGFDFYKKKYLRYRFGNILGNIMYCLTKIKFIDRLGAFFVLDTAVGKLFYNFICTLLRNPDKKR